MFWIIFLILIIISIVIISKSISLNKGIANTQDKINSFFDELEELKKDYIPYSKYMNIKNKYKKLYLYTINNSYFIEFNEFYKNLKKNIDDLNKEYINNELINQKEYFDNLFEYKIDNDQRKAILTDDDNNLIVAGAGSGKTTTIIGKVKYLLDKKNINPEEIITISFTNNAVKNFEKKLNNDDVLCTTFHKLGLNILSDNGKKRDNNKISLQKIILEYLKNDIYNNPEKLKYFITFCALYMHIPTDYENKNLGEIFEFENGYDLRTIKSKYINYNLLKKKESLSTLNNEVVRSYEELVIANYLFINGISYEYETSYKYDTSNEKYRQYHPDFYLMDYDIYLEHFGINKQGRAPQYDINEEKRYLDQIIEKRKIHQKYNTKLIETYSYNFKDHSIFNRIDEQLKKHGIKYKPLKDIELANVILYTQNEELNSFCALIKKFIRQFKGNNFKENKFDEFIEDAKKTNNNRNFLLLNLIKDIYIKYQNKLKIKNIIDFDDMINLAAEKVKNGLYNKKISYIIIDEFQDISYSRFSLIKALKEVNDLKIVAVGDDWQSIFRFSGCDLDLFVNFQKYFENPKILNINTTYRNSQQLIDLSSKFILKNKNNQLTKKITSHISLEKPVEFYYYDKDILKATQEAVKQLIKIGCKKIAILGRNTSDLKKYINIKVDEIKKEYDLSDIFNFNVLFTTIHKSKGLEYDGVIICNMLNFVAGFPNKMTDDPILNYVTLSKEDFLYAEERRLFYVALTRTKSKCILLVPVTKPSCFVDELHSIENKYITKKVIEDSEQLHNPNCPICQNGVLLSRLNSKDNSTFVSCSNYPKCKFKYKSTEIIKKPIKCPECNGYLVKRKGIYGEFYGCVNYPYCNQTLEIYDIEKDN